MSSPWATIAKVEPVRLQDIMSEQFAHGLQTRDDHQFAQQLADSQQAEVESVSAAATATADDNANVDETNAAKSADHANDNAATADAADDAAAAAAAAVVDDAETAAALQCASDELIAQLMQAQFDRQHNEELRQHEQQQNRNSKVTVSFRQHRRATTVGDGDDVDDSDDDYGPAPVLAVDPSERRDWDRYETNQRIMDALPKRGYTIDQHGVKITKHDAQLNGVRNAGRVMSLPPEVHTGDTSAFDLQLTNPVFNQLKKFSFKSMRQSSGGGGGGGHGGHRAHDRREKMATTEMGLDQQSYVHLFKLVSNGALERVNGIVSTGKEAVILHADARAEQLLDGVPLPRECAVKLFITSLNEFKQRDRYIKDDYRFCDRFSKQNARVVIEMWAEKEFHNLSRMHQLGIRCPRVLYLKKNMLLMAFVGADGVAAPKLKDVRLTEEQHRSAHAQVVAAMHRMWSEAKLVHADMSEYNVLWYEEECWIIDVAQAVEQGHPSALEFLMRDCGNISRFFTRRGVDGVLSKEELFRSITGLDPFVHNAIMLERIHDKGPSCDLATVNNVDSMPEHLRPRAFPFDYAWDKVNESKELCERMAALGEADEPGTEDTVDRVVTVAE